VNNIARVLDFENAQPLSSPDNSEAKEELEMLPEELKDTSDRGAGF